MKQNDMENLHIIKLLVSSSFPKPNLRRLNLADWVSLRGRAYKSFLV